MRTLRVQTSTHYESEPHTRPNADGDDYIEGNAGADAIWGDYGRDDLIEKDGWWEQPASLDGDPVWTHHKEKQRQRLLHNTCTVEFVRRTLRQKRQRPTPNDRRCHPLCARRVRGDWWHAKELFDKRDGDDDNDDGNVDDDDGNGPQ